MVAREDDGGRNVRTILSPQVEELGRQHISFADVTCLPRAIRDLINNPDTWEDPRVLEWTTRNSRIARVLHENPASDEMLRIVYPDSNGGSVTRGLDRFLSKSLSGQALRDRLDVCSEWIARHFVAPGSTVVDLGGGSGSYAFGAYGLQGDEVPQGHTWRIVDLDVRSLHIARDLAYEHGVESTIQTVGKNFMSEDSVVEPHDFAVLIGVICGMSPEVAISCLKRAKAHLKPGGEILAATLLKRSFEEDPQTFRVLCNVGGWQLRPKRWDEVRHIFDVAGWDILDMFFERPDNQPGQYAIVHARISS